MVGRGYGDYFFVGGEGLEPVQTLVQIAAYGGFEPEVIKLQHVHFYMKGGSRTFAASAKFCDKIWKVELGVSDLSLRFM